MSLSSRDSSSRDTTLLFQIFTIIRISYIILFFFRIVVLWEGRVFSISAQKASLLVFVSLSGIFVSFKITDFFLCSSLDKRSLLLLLLRLPSD